MTQVTNYAPGTDDSAPTYDTNSEDSARLIALPKLQTVSIMNLPWIGNMEKAPYTQTYTVEITTPSAEANAFAYLTVKMDGSIYFNNIPYSEYIKLGSTGSTLTLQQGAQERMITRIRILHKM